ncbi:hypothetical protein ACH3XW_28365 [Acanthocheilonema viteae]
MEKRNDSGLLMVTTHFQRIGTSTLIQKLRKVHRIRWIVILQWVGLRIVIVSPLLLVSFFSANLNCELVEVLSYMPNSYANSEISG